MFRKAVVISVCCLWCAIYIAHEDSRSAWMFAGPVESGVLFHIDRFDLRTCFVDTGRANFHLFQGPLSRGRNGEK